MRCHIRWVSLLLLSLVLSAVGCGIPAGNTGPSASSVTPTGGQVPAETNPSPEPSAEFWRPVAEEVLDGEALDTWMDMRLLQMNYATPQQIREYVHASVGTVPMEVADGMAWEYIKILRDYRETLIRYYLTPEAQAALLDAYQGGDTFDESALDDSQRIILDNMKGLEYSWALAEGMLEIHIRYDNLLAWVKGCSPVFARYLDLLAMDAGQAPAVDGALRVSHGELARRTLAIEDFLACTSGTPFQSDVEELYIRYLYLLLSGKDIPPASDMQCNDDTGNIRLNSDAEAAFRHILDTAPRSATAAAVSDWWDQLKALADDGAGEDAYRQVWEGFGARVEGYASAAGVRTPRIHMTIRSEQTESDIFNSNMEYPVFYGEGISDATLEGMVNRITGDLVEILTYVRDMAQPDHDAAVEEGYERMPYGAYSVLHLPRSAGPVVSVVTDVEGYMGGAHGMGERIGYNFDSATGKVVSLESLFKPNADPWSLLETDVNRQIALIQDRVRESQSDTEYLPYQDYRGLSPDHQWYVTDEGIVVVFLQYEIAPYAAGMPEFTVPWWRLADSLK